MRWGQIKMNRSLQRGATLIIVLCIVLLVTIIATVAIRQSSVSLNIATGAQAQKLMMQNSDAALLRFEQLHKQNSSAAVNSLFSTIKKNIGKEVVWCYSDLQRDFFTLNNSSLIYWIAGNTQATTIGNDGFCRSNSFSTGRSTVVTQVAATISLTNSSVITNSSSNDNSVPPVKIIVYTTSFIPTLSTANADAINACLSTRVSGRPTYVNKTESNPQTYTVSECLSALNVPNYTAVAEYQSEN